MKPQPRDADQPSMTRTGRWFLAAGVVVSVRAAIEFANPVYWNPSSVLDYSAALLTTAAWVVTGVAFILWWRTTPIRRGSLLLLVAGVGLAVEGIGNLLEDVFDLEIGDLLFTFGGMVGAVSVLLAAIFMLTVRNPLRWSALLLFAFLAGGIFPDSGGQFVAGASLLGLGFVLVRYRPADSKSRTSRP